MEWYEIAFGVGGGIAGWVLLSDVARNLWGRTFGRRHVARRKVEQLSTSVTEEWFRSILGPPAMARSHEGLTEKVWVDPLFYVQAIVDQAGQVVQWAITSRSLKFRPTFGGAHRRPFTAQLHTTRFAELGDAIGVDAIHGARRIGYSEQHYWGNPAAYQNFAFGVSDAAPSIAGDDVYAVVSAVNPFEGEPLDLGDVLVMPQRARIAPNTYAETSPDGSWATGFSVGADLDHVRVVP